MQELKIAIVGPGEKALNLYQILQAEPRVKVYLIINSDGTIFPENNLETDVRLSNSLSEIGPDNIFDLILDISGDHQVEKELEKNKGPQAQIFRDSGTNLLVALSNQKNELDSYFYSLMDSISDGIVISDANGQVLHVNDSFKKLTGDYLDDLPGQNLNEKYPDNPILKCLRTGEKISGQRYSLAEGTQDLSFTISPIITNGKTNGAVGIFKFQPDIVKLMEELQRSSNIIETLYNRLGSISGLTEINVSEIIPIDKMEVIMLRHALAQFGHTVEGKKKAAKALNISLATLYNKLKKYQVN